MSSEIIVNAGREETRVALLENGLVTEIYIDRKKDRGIAGNVYKSRVMKVLPGMQAAFVDIGMEKSAFLYVGDVFDSTSEYAPMMEDEGLELEVEPKRKRSHANQIEDLLQEGQDILVQVSKEPISTKGARVTTYISIPGRYLVMMPGVNHIGVSRRIENGEERKRLREIVSRLRKPNTGYIIRTASQGRSEEEFTADIEFLSRVWENIQKKKDRVSAPALLHNELDLVFRVIRDTFTRDVDRMIIDSEEEYQRVKDFVDSYIPGLGRRVKPYDGDDPIFEHYGVEIEISRALGRKVWLKSGRVHHHRPDRGAHDDRREHRTVRGQAVARGHDPQDQPRGGPGDRLPAPAPEHRRHHHPRLHRHGARGQPPQGLFGAPGGALATTRQRRPSRTSRPSA